MLFAILTAIRVKDLDAMVGRVCYDDAGVGTDCDAARPRETPGLAPPAPQLIQLSTLLEVVCPRGHTSVMHTDHCHRRGRRGALHVF